MHHSVMIEPMLGSVNLRPYFSKYRKEDGTPLIEIVTEEHDGEGLDSFKINEMIRDIFML